MYYQVKILLFALLIAFDSVSLLAVPGDSLKLKVTPLKVTLKEVGKLPKILKEASGLERTGKYFWSHNDDGIPALYCIDSVGNLKRAVQLNISNKGWEDLALDDQGNMFIGGFGNNKNDKKDLKIYRIPNPETITQYPVNPDIIRYKYADQKAWPPDNTNKNFDMDAMMSLNNKLYLFSKNRTNPFNGYSKVYELTPDPGDQVAQVIDSIFVGDGPMMNNWITSADMSPDKKTLALLFHDRVWLIRNWKGNKFSTGKIFELNLNNYSHKAGICFRDNETIFIVDELELDLIGGKMYSIDLRQVMKELNRK